MANEKRLDLIDRNDLLPNKVFYVNADNPMTSLDELLNRIANAPTVDAVFVETIEAWLYQIAMNNTDNYLCDACQEIISRLDGLRAFAKDKEA